MPHLTGITESWPRVISGEYRYGLENEQWTLHIWRLQLDQTANLNVSVTGCV